MAMEYSDNDAAMSRDEARVCEALLRFEEDLTADPTCAPPHPPDGLSANLLAHWNRACAGILQLHRAFGVSAQSAQWQPRMVSSESDEFSTGNQSRDSERTIRLSELLRQENRGKLAVLEETHKATVLNDEIESLANFGRFQNLQLLGTGAIGMVYAAFDPQCCRTVALKIPRAATLGSDDLRRRFIREAEAAGRLCHPGIVSVYEIGEVARRVYIVAEYCPGPTLSAWLAQRTTPVSPRDAAALVLELADAVQHAHGRGVLHRDIKPTNVLLERQTINAEEVVEEPRSSDWRPKLTDFGLAKILENREGDTLAGVILGTPEYMSPEQAQGRIGDLDATTDVYALGGLLYRILASRPPFEGATPAAILHRVVYDTPRSLRRARSDIPRDLEAICLKCLAKLPEERYLTAHELALDLRRFLRGTATEARPLRPWEHLASWARRRPAAAALACTLVISVLLLSALMGIYHQRLSAAYRREMPTRHDLQQEMNANRQHLWAADFASAWEELQKDRGTALRQYFAIHGSPGEDRQRSTFAEMLLRSRFENGEHTLYQHRGAVYAAEFSPDGTFIASAGADGRIHLYERSTRKLTSLPPDAPANGKEINALAFLGDGTLLAAGGDDGFVRIWDWSKHQLLTELTPELFGVTNVLDVCFSPNRKLLAVATRRGEVRFFSTTNWQELPGRRLTHPGPVNSVSFSVDSGFLVTACEDCHVRVWDLTQITVANDWASKPTHCAAVKFAHHSQLLATALQQDHTIEIWNRVDDKRIRSLIFGNRWIQSLDFSADDHWLAFSNKDGAVGLIDMERQEVANVLFTNREVWTVRLSKHNNDLLLGSDDGSVRLIEFSKLAPHHYTRSFPAPLADVCFPSQSDRIVTRRKDGTVQVWDSAMTEVLGDLHTQAVIESEDVFALQPGTAVVAVARDDECRLADLTTGRELRRLEPAAGRIMSIAFDPQGKRIVGGHDGGEIRAWDVESGKLLRRLETPQKSIYAMAFTEDGQRLITAGANRLCLRDATTLERIGEPIVLVGESKRLSVQPGGSLVAANDSDVLLLWDLGSNTVRRFPAHDSEITTIAFGPSGRNLITGGTDGTLWLWDVKTMRKIARLVRDAVQVTNAAFSRDGRVLAACVLNEDSQAEVRIWNVTDPAESPESPPDLPTERLQVQSNVSPIKKQAARTNP